ncbi:MAG: MBL fold metallo-hydrolase [Chloroflexota bacterium]
MGLTFCSLSSSSVFGNSFLVRGADGTTIMIDCGVRLRRLEALLAEVGIAPAGIAGLFLSHEHTDHTIALRLRKPFAARHGIPVFAEHEFWRVWDRESAGDLPHALRRTIRPGEPVSIGSLRVRAIRKPHDTESSVGFLVSDGDERLAVLTDLGHVPASVEQELGAVHHFVFESNHDVNMERSSGRPWPLVQRVLGDYGHLSNEQCLAALMRLAGPQTRTVLLAHLSIDCNDPELARSVVCGGLAAAGRRCAIEVAAPNRPSGWLPRG